jgi:hypothetical protein
MGAIAVSTAATSLALGWRTPVCWVFGMALLDAGTQVALVANQARAQALAEDAGVRGRLAAIVTTVGFMGGALGSAAGNLLVGTGLFP